MLTLLTYSLHLCKTHKSKTHQGSCTSICSTSLPGSPYPCHGPKTKKIMYDLAENDDFDREMIATYEEVAKLYPRPGIYRPIVLIGAPGKLILVSVWCS